MGVTVGMGVDALVVDTLGTVENGSAEAEVNSEVEAVRLDVFKADGVEGDEMGLVVEPLSIGLVAEGAGYAAVL